MAAANVRRAVFAGVLGFMSFGAGECAVYGQPARQSQPLSAAGNLNGRPLLQAQGEDRITVSGARISMGDGVDCPKIRADDGMETPISYLAPSIAIGDRVEVTGFMAVMTTCRGKVLFAEEVRALGK